jgi:hypothetical protein
MVWVRGFHTPLRKETIIPVRVGRVELELYCFPYDQPLHVDFLARILVVLSTQVDAVFSHG